MGSDGAMLELNGLRRRYGDVAALDGLSFTVPPGQVFGFLGPNRAGKTMAMRAIVGVASRDGGDVRWNGAAIGDAERSRIGYMPEERGLYPTMRSQDKVEALSLGNQQRVQLAAVCERAIVRTGTRLKVRQVLRSPA